MQIDEAVREFKEIYFDEVGIKLSNKEATEKATSLLNLFRVLTGIDAEDDNED